MMAGEIRRVQKEEEKNMCAYEKRLKKYAYKMKTWEGFFCDKNNEIIDQIFV